MTPSREIFAHAKAIADRFDLYRNACFQTEVTELRWDENRLRWIISTNRGDAMKARFVCLANGFLQKPKLPGIPGIEAFKGHVFHTSRCPSDPQFEPYFALAEELGIPVGIHTGTSAPRSAFGDPANGARPRFRLRYGNPLLLEDMLVRHPKLRVFMMHMGDPWLSETLAMLKMYPDLYLDLSVKNWVSPREVFHHYLKALMDAGYGDRLMFGSDQALWPEAIGLAIEGIESADFLTEDQKRDIFYNNAVRFFRLEGRCSST